MTAASWRPGDGDRRVTLVILDGARPDVFRELAERGDLPAVNRHLLEPGGMTPATTVFPSTTGVAYLPFLTGCHPGTCDLPGIRWLDRRRYGGRWWRDRAHVRSYCGYQAGLLGPDLADGVTTLFQHEPDSVGLCTPLTTGLKPERIRLARSRTFWGGIAHYLPGVYAVLDDAAGRALVRTARERPRLTFAVLPGVDGVSHHTHPRHPRVLDLYRRFDRWLGAYADAGGFEGDHLFLLVSDHGLTEMQTHTDLSVALERRGIPTLRHPVVWRRDPRVAVMVSGNASAQLYLRPAEGRGGRRSLSAIEAGAVPGVPADLVTWLLGLPGVDLVVGTEGADVVVCAADGRARISEDHDGRIRYAPVGGDPLRLGDATVARGEREWLETSVDGPYPDAVVQLVRLFRSPRAGDLVVTAEDGADLRDDWEFPEHRSGHGSLIAGHMRCLLVANRPLAGPLRTVDVFPLVLEHLGLPIPDGIDGTLLEPVYAG